MFMVFAFEVLTFIKSTSNREYSPQQLILWFFFSQRKDETHLTYLHGLVVDDLAVEDVLVHSAHDLGVVLVKILLDERTLQQRPENVDELNEDETKDI